MLKGKKIGVVLTGSFCTYEKVFPQIEKMIEQGADVVAVFSDYSQMVSSRFGSPGKFLEKARKLTGKEPIATIAEAETIGPKGDLDLLVICPCTGNTMAKLANGITDSPALMAAKAHLRNEKPLVIAVSTNDALGMNMKNIGLLINVKNIYFVPFGQDDPEKKPNSMVAHLEQVIPTMQKALAGQQIQPVIYRD